MLSYFLSQGIAANHKVCVWRAPKETSRQPYFPSYQDGRSQSNTHSSDKQSIEKSGEPSDDMKIAWRYKNLAKAKPAFLLFARKVGFTR